MVDPSKNRQNASYSAGVSHESHEIDMVSNFSLHEWLQSESAAGTLDSEGEFTIVQSKAWEKLGEFQLPFPEAWVLKLVQAALSTPYTRLAVVQTREETRFDFTHAPEWSGTELEKAIFDTSYKAAPSLDHLAIAVRALARKKTRPFSIQYADGNRVAWNGSSFSTLDPDAPRAASLTLTVTNYEFGESKIIFSAGNSQAARFRADISGALCEHCHLAGERVTLDSKSLISYWSDPDFGKSDTSHPLTVLKAHPISLWQPIELKGEFYSPQSQLHDKKIAVSLPTEREAITSFSAAAILSFFYRPELFRRDMKLDKWIYHPLDRQSRILWYSDGVIVKREPLGYEGPVGLGLIVSAEGLPTDLTGFTPLDSLEKRERIRQAVALLQPRLKELSQTIGEEPFSVKGLRSDTVVLGFVGATVAFTFPIIGVPWVVGSGFKVSKEMKENKELQFAYNNGLASLVEYFNGFAELYNHEYEFTQD